LDAQIALINPLVIVTLGRFSMARWFPNERISRIHGVAKQVGDRWIVPMYHPAAALHQASLRSTIEADFAKLPRMVAVAREAATEPRDADSRAAQMRLFDI